MRNGEGVHHVVRASVTGARSFDEARAIGKSVVNSPLLKAAVNGNDPNVGRLLCAVGKLAGAAGIPLDPARVTMRVGDDVVLEGGAMRLDPAKEERLVAHLKAAELYASAPSADGLFRPPIDYPPMSGESRSGSTRDGQRGVCGARSGPVARVRHGERGLSELRGPTSDRIS